MKKTELPRWATAFALPLLNLLSALLVAALVIHLAAQDGGHEPFGDDRRLEVGGRAGLRQRQVGRVTQGVHVGAAAHLKRRAVGRQPATRRRRQA